MTKLLLYRLDRAPPEDVSHLRAIDRVAQALQKLCGVHIKISEDTMLESLLAGAASHLGPWENGDLMVSKSEFCDGLSDDSCHILAAGALLDNWRLWHL